MSIGSKDLISSLPDGLVCHILSFLSAKDAALTSVLSKRWRYLLASVPSLDFDDSIYDDRNMDYIKRQEMSTSFKVFVDRVMALQANAPIKKFSLRCRSDPSYVKRWISNVLERGVVDLDLYISSQDDYLCPPKVFMSKTLVTLKVKDIYDLTVEEVFLPKLKTLYLEDVGFDDVGFDDVGFEENGAELSKLISSCPVLEELVMIDVQWFLWKSLSVSHPTLSRLKIHCDYTDENEKSVSFDTPNLVSLELYDDVAITYPKVKFNSLVEASVLLDKNQTAAGDSANATDFFFGICNVKMFYLTAATLEVLSSCSKAIPVFKNLIHLTIETDREVGWESLPSLLQKCPNLETLIFQGLHYKDTNQCLDESYSFKYANVCRVNNGDRCVCKPWEGTPLCLSSSPVKILKVFKFGDISGYKDDIDKQTEVVKYLLATMPNLEQVVLYYDTPIDGDVYMISAVLEMLQEVASPKCKIQIISDNISLSSIVGSSSSTNGLVFFKNMFPV